MIGFSGFSPTRRDPAMELSPASQVADQLQIAVLISLPSQPSPTLQIGSRRVGGKGKDGKQKDEIGSNMGERAELMVGVTEVGLKGILK
jgi:hypothetical protein